MSDVKQQGLCLKGGVLVHASECFSLSEASDHSLTIEPASSKHIPFYGMTGHIHYKKSLWKLVETNPSGVCKTALRS